MSRCISPSHSQKNTAGQQDYGLTMVSSSCMSKFHGLPVFGGTRTAALTYIVGTPKFKVTYKIPLFVCLMFKA